MSTERTKKIPEQQHGPNGEPLCRWCLNPIPKGTRRRTFCSQVCVDEALIRAHPARARAAVEERDKGICQTCGRDTRELRRHHGQLRALGELGIMAYDRLQKKAGRRFGIPPERFEAMVRRGGWTIHERIWSDETEAEIERMRKRHDRQLHRHRENPRRYPPPHSGHRPFDQDPQIQRRVANMREDAFHPTPQERRMRRVSSRLKRLARARLERWVAELQAEGFHEVNLVKAKNLWQADHIQPVSEGGGACGLENLRTLCLPCHKAETRELARCRALRRKGIDPDNLPPELPLG